MRSIAELEFKQRGPEYDEAEDGLNFQGWYHVDDCRRILWRIYHQLDNSVKEESLPPYVFFDGGDDLALDRLLNPVIDYLNGAKGKKYAPFIFKPELGNAHYIAGFIRKNKGAKPTLVFFNPTGTLPRVDFGTYGPKNQPNDKIEIISSAHKIQTLEKDNNKLVSCGPLSVAFIEYALTNPDYMASVGKEFILPDVFKQLVDSQNADEYRRYMLNLRAKHNSVLSEIDDASLKLIEKSSLAITNAILNYSADDLESTSDYHSDDDVSDDVIDDAFDESSFTPLYQPDPNSNVEKIEETKTSNPEERENVRFIRSEIGSFTPLYQPNRNSNVEKIEETKTSNPKEREDVRFIRSEIERFRKNGLSFFGINNNFKADKIEKALNLAIEKGVQNVCLDKGVKDALAYHRIFSFFGLKTTNATSHNEEHIKQHPKKT